VLRGRSEHARSDDCHGFEYAAAYKLAQVCDSC
jgi:hypothetical protein